MAADQTFEFLQRLLYPLLVRSGLFEMGPERLQLLLELFLARRRRQDLKQLRGCRLGPLRFGACTDAMIHV